MKNDMIPCNEKLEKKLIGISKDKKYSQEVRDYAKNYLELYRADMIGETSVRKFINYPISTTNIETGCEGSC